MKIKMLQKSVIVLLFNLCLSSVVLAAGVIDLPQTGQTKSYAVGDDGDLRHGQPWPEPRFVPGTDTESDCIVDKLTGLMWPKNGNLANTTMTWQQAIDYANGLNLCGHSDWRLPEMKELTSMHNAGEADTALWLNRQGFTNMQSDFYWSSTPLNDSSNPGFAWYINLADGTTNSASVSDNLLYFWPVRGGQASKESIDAAATRFTKIYCNASGLCPTASACGDGSQDMVKDNLSGLIWARNANIFGEQNWYVAIDLSNNLSLCGYSYGWYLPNIDELKSLVINGGTVPYSNWLKSQGFNNVQSDYYWSSTSLKL